MASFGSTIGGGSPIEQAMARRGIDASVLAQQSPASPGFQMIPATTRQTNNAMPDVNFGGSPAPAPQPPQMPQQPPQAPAPTQPSVFPTTPPPPPQSSYPVMTPTQAAPPNPEVNLILNALTDRLKHHSAVEKAKTQLGRT